MKRLFAEGIFIAGNALSGVGQTRKRRQLGTRAADAGGDSGSTPPIRREELRMAASRMRQCARRSTFLSLTIYRRLR